MKYFLFILCLCITMAPSFTFAQDGPGTNNDDHALVQQLLQKIQQLEERLQQVESQQQATQNTSATNLPQVSAQLKPEAGAPIAMAQPVPDTQAAMSSMDHGSQ